MTTPRDVIARHYYSQIWVLRGSGPRFEDAQPQVVTACESEADATIAKLEAAGFKIVKLD